MNGDEAAVAVIDALEAAGIPYMVVGSLASNVYGNPRSTQDADFILETTSALIVQLADRLGPPFRLDPQPSFEMVTMTMRYVMEVIGIPYKIELFLLKEEPYDQERFRRRRRAKVLGRDVFLPTAEDVVIQKVRWAFLARRSKDRDDARNVIAVQGNRLDWNYVNVWCDRLGCRVTLDEIRKSLPPI